MIKPNCLKKGDKVAIVSLSAGILGESFIKHELDLALKRLKKMELIPVIMPNALKGIDCLKEHPELRASDLKEAFQDESIKAIICAIGGNDTYRLIPFLMEDEEFKSLVIKNPKIFTGFSDSTIDHLILNKLGLTTFYGPNLLVDIAELDKEMLPYTKKYFDKYFLKEDYFLIESSPIWYKDRNSYGVEELGKSREIVNEIHGFETLHGQGIVTGTLYGGCIDSFYASMTNTEQKDIFVKYEILPTLEEWKNHILFLETSDEAPTPKDLEKMLMEFKKRGILSQVKGILVGKPIDEKYYEEYKEVYRNIFADLKTPILYNVNFGHSVPRCILPYGILTEVDYDKRTIKITEPIFRNK